MRFPEVPVTITVAMPRCVPFPGLFMPLPPQPLAASRQAVANRRAKLPARPGIHLVPVTRRLPMLLARNAPSKTSAGIGRIIA